MKPLFSLTAVLSLSLPLFASAAPSPVKSGSVSQIKTKATSQIEPAAVALLDQAIAAYKAPNGVRLKWESRQQGAKKEFVTEATLQWKPPSSLLIEKKSPQDPSYSLVVFADGKNAFFLYNKTTLQKRPFVAGKMSVVELAGVAGGGMAQLLPSVLSGQNFLRNPQMPSGGDDIFQLFARILPRTNIEGSECDGLRHTARISYSKQKIQIETTGWFDTKDHLLRRVQMIVTMKNQRFVTIDRILETDLNPTFAPDAFSWTPPPGVTEETEEDTSVYWDPKLVPGATPHALVGKDLTGKAVSLDKYKGKVVLLDFWATWCGPCVEEVPNVIRNYRKYHAKGFEIIGISLDNDQKSLTSFIKAHKMPWPQVFDKSQVQFKAPNAARYKVQGIPFMLLIGKDGKIAAINPRGPELEKAIKAALAR